MFDRKKLSWIFQANHRCHWELLKKYPPPVFNNEIANQSLSQKCVILSSQENTLSGTGPGITSGKGKL